MLIHNIPLTAENQPSVFCAPNAKLSILPSHCRQEGKSIKSSSGFSGKGFKFDETEHALANERKKLQKHALGLQDSDDEDGPLDVSTDHPPQGGEFERPRYTIIGGRVHPQVGLMDQPARWCSPLAGWINPSFLAGGPSHRRCHCRVYV